MLLKYTLVGKLSESVEVRVCEVMQNRKNGVPYLAFRAIDGTFVVLDNVSTYIVAHESD